MPVPSLTIKASDFTAFPCFENPWNSQGFFATSPCIAYALNDPDSSIVNLGNGTLCRHILKDEFRISAEGVAMPEPLRALEGTRFFADAKKHWESALRDGYRQIEPDENHTLDVPEGYYPVLLTIHTDPMGPGGEMKYGGKYRPHFYRANQPDDKGRITWSHWEGNDGKKPTNLMNNEFIVNPEKQVAFNKDRPIGFFLVPGATLH